MKLFGTKPYRPGYNPILSFGGCEDLDGLCVGMAYLKRNGSFALEAKGEGALLLVQGKVTFTIDGNTYFCDRSCWKDSPPCCLYFPLKTSILIESLADSSEVCLVQTHNNKPFTYRYISPASIKTQPYLSGAENSVKGITRLILPAEEQRTLQMAETVTSPGHWGMSPLWDSSASSVCLNKYYPSNGFSLAIAGQDSVFSDEDTAYINPKGGIMLSVAAPGYQHYSLHIGLHD